MPIVAGRHTRTRTRLARSPIRLELREARPLARLSFTANFPSITTSSDHPTGTTVTRRSVQSVSIGKEFRSERMGSSPWGVSTDLWPSSAT